MDYFIIILALLAIFCVALVYDLWIRRPSEGQLLTVLQKLMQFRAIVAQSGKPSFDILQSALQATIAPGENPVTKFRELLLNSGIQPEALAGHDKLLLDEVSMWLDDRNYRKIIRESKNLMEAYKEGYREAKRPH